MIAWARIKIEKLFNYLRTLYIKKRREYTSESSKNKIYYRVEKKITS